MHCWLKEKTNYVFFSTKWRKKRRVKRQRWVCKESRLFGASFALVCVRDVWLFTYIKTYVYRLLMAATTTTTTIVVVAVLCVFHSLYAFTFFSLSFQQPTGFGVWTLRRMCYAVRVLVAFWYVLIYLTHIIVVWFLFVPTKNVYNFVHTLVSGRRAICRVRFLARQYVSYIDSIFSYLVMK